MSDSTEASNGVVGHEGEKPTGEARKKAPGDDSIIRTIRDRITWGRLLGTVTTVTIVAVVLVFTGTLRPGSDEPVSAAGTIAAVRDVGKNTYVFGSLAPTNEWVNFYGLESTFGRDLLPFGTMITAYDPQGVVCGEFIVTQEGRYGLMPVYRDDPSTVVDEGAVPGDTINFRLDGVRANIVGPDLPVWTAMGDLKQVNLALPRGLTDRLGGKSK